MRRGKIALKIIFECASIRWKFVGDNLIYSFNLSLRFKFCQHETPLTSSKAQATIWILMNFITIFIFYAKHINNLIISLLSFVSAHLLYMGKNLSQKLLSQNNNFSIIMLYKASHCMHTRNEVSNLLSEQ